MSRFPLRLSAARAAVLLVVAGTLPLMLAVRPTRAEERPVLNAADFESIQHALDSLPAEGGTVVVPAGTQPILEKLRLRSHVELRGAGIDQTVLVLADGVNDHLISNANLTNGNTAITIRDLGLRGNAANQSVWSFGVRLVNVTDTLIENVEASDFTKDGFYLGYNRERGVQNVRVSGCRAVGNRRYGLALKHGSGNRIEGCSFEGNGFVDEGAAVKLGPDERLDASGNQIVGNRAVGNYAGFVLFAALDYDSRVADNLVCSNLAEANLTVGFQDFRGSGNRFVGNTAVGNGQDFDLGAALAETEAPDACAVSAPREAALR